MLDKVTECVTDKKFPKFDKIVTEIYFTAALGTSTFLPL